MAKTLPTILSSLVTNPIPATNSLVSSLKSCSTIRDFSPIHAHLITTNLIRDPFLASHVLWFFVSREEGYSDYARRVFSQSPELEVTVWNTLLENHLKDDDDDDDDGDGSSSQRVFLTYSHMVAHGVSFDISTFHFLIHACSRNMEFRSGTEVHGRLVKSGMARNKSLNNNLMGFYSKFGKLDDVRQVFDKMSHRDVISWNTVISCHVRMGMHREALNLFAAMRADGVAADEVTVVSLLSACSKLRDLETGERLHGFVVENGLELRGSLLNCLVNMYIECGRTDRAHELVAGSGGGDVVLWTSLVGGYVKADKFRAARCVFDHIAEKNLISWMTIISGHVRGGRYRESLELFREMRAGDVIPDEVLVVTALSACTRADGDYCRFGRSVHGIVVKLGMVVDGLLGNSLLHFYSNCEEQDEADFIFKRLPEKSVASLNSALDGLCRSGDIDKAMSFFDEIPNRDVVSWNTIINLLAKSCRFGELLELFREMQGSPVRPDKLTLISVLSACAAVGALSHGVWVHTYAEKNRITVDSVLGTALIDMYGKCGSVERAREVFSELTEKNVFAWTAMIAAHAMEGQASEAIGIYSEMEAAGINPDGVTFVALLSACSHGGLVSEGLEYFAAMSSIHGISPDIRHYGCIVDLLGRSGRLDEALKFIELMPIEPDVAVWSVLLRSCGAHRRVEMAEHAFRRLADLDPLSDSAHVLLSKAYTSAGRLDDARRVREKMWELGIRKERGQSAVELDGIVHEFTASDISSPETPRIYRVLDEIGGALEELGVDKRSAHHSERLAVALGLIHGGSTSTPIRVANNQRICGDCHTAMKLMSRVYNREIIIRDNFRFHRFVDGNCTCKDKW